MMSFIKSPDLVSAGFCFRAKCKKYDRQSTMEATLQTLEGVETERDEPRSPSAKRCIPHNGAICGNNLCDSPDVAPDERLCPGPKGMDICGRCYKRFKVERRHAMEDRRAITNDWMRPRKRRSVVTCGCHSCGPSPSGFPPSCSGSLGV